MVTYDETINTFITLGLSELEGEVICFRNLGIKIMECKAPLAYELKIIDKRFIAENWDRIIKTYQWMLTENEVELNPCKELEGYQLIMWMFRNGVEERLKDSKFFNQNKRNNIYINKGTINRLLYELDIEHETEKENVAEMGYGRG